MQKIFNILTAFALICSEHFNLETVSVDRFLVTVVEPILFLFVYLCGLEYTHLTEQIWILTL